jgi:hypothetical protein
MEAGAFRITSRRSDGSMAITSLLIAIVAAISWPIS